MFRIYITLLSVLLFLAIGQRPTGKQCTVFVEGRGSLPPLPEIYNCVHELDGKPYDADNTKSCLNSILASGYFESGRIELFQEKSSLFVKFGLEARPLKLEIVDFDTESSLKSQMLAWIRSTRDAVRIGNIYQAQEDARTSEIINYFFWNIGKRVGITRNVDLDYVHGLARLSYQITPGPNMVPIRALPPYEPACKEAIQSFVLTDLDDLVPIAIVARMTKSHAFGCFDPQSVAQDQETLEKSGLFQEAGYNVGGGAGNRQISLHIRGKPLRVKEVKIAGYGLFSNRSFDDESGLTIGPGKTYLRSTAYDSLEYLERKYARPHAVVTAFEDDQLTADEQLVVTFQVFGYEADTVTVNGKQFMVGLSSLTVHPLKPE